MPTTPNVPLPAGAVHAHDWETQGRLFTALRQGEGF
jgi:hypothetical protein